MTTAARFTPTPRRRLFWLRERLSFRAPRRRPILAVCLVALFSTIVAGVIAVAVILALLLFGAPAYGALAIIWPFGAAVLSAEIVRRAKRPISDPGHD